MISVELPDAFLVHQLDRHVPVFDARRRQGHGAQPAQLVGQLAADPLGPDELDFDQGALDD